MKNTRLQLTDNVMEVMMKMADGNPGAAMTLVDILKQGSDIDPDSALGGIGNIFQLDDYGIYGTDIYVLHNDICDRNLSKTLGLLRATQLGFLDRETLALAASKQDRSGKDMIPVQELCAQVKERLPNFNLSN